MKQPRYTLFTRIPLYINASGELLTDQLWEKDLSAHLVYLSNFHICCPMRPAGDAKGSLVRIPELDVTRVHKIPHNIGWLQVVQNILPTFLSVARAAKKSDVVHSGGAGWPFPLSFYLALLRPFLRFKWLIVVESSFWRLEPGEVSSVRQKLTHHAYRILLPLCLKLADARIFTQEDYRQSLFGRKDATLVYPAVWFDADSMETPADLAKRHKCRGKALPKAIFPARLVPEKGIDTVLEAISLLEELLPASSVPLLQIDIMGEGVLAQKCASFADTHSGKVVVKYIEIVSYGQTFFNLLKDNDAVIIANKKAEQPRIAFDAFSQGLPLIASRTPGICDIAENGVTAAFFDVGDAAGLAKALWSLIEDREAFNDMGRNALKAASRYTHQEMHHVRHEFLNRTVLQ